jgi:hypothetical protein
LHQMRTCKQFGMRYPLGQLAFQNTLPVNRNTKTVLFAHISFLGFASSPITVYSMVLGFCRPLNLVFITCAHCYTKAELCERMIFEALTHPTPNPCPAKVVSSVKHDTSPLQALQMRAPWPLPHTAVFFSRPPHPHPQPHAHTNR